jgi:hypothetical protein
VAMNPKAEAGLKKWAKLHGTADIAEHLEGHDFDEDSARRLAVWIRKKAIGESKFKQHQKLARQGKPVPLD